MLPKRITDPSEVELHDDGAASRPGEALTSSSVTRPIRRVARRSGFARGRFGDLLEVRFYGHHQGSFDCAILEKLPAVTNLSIDCLPRASNVEALAQLTNLRRLSLGIEELSDPNVLAYPNLRGLRDLTVGETRAALSTSHTCGAFLGSKACASAVIRVASKRSQRFAR